MEIANTLIASKIINVFVSKIRSSLHDYHKNILLINDKFFREILRRL